MQASPVTETMYLYFIIILRCIFEYLYPCKVSQDVPKFMMVSGDRAELRGLNLEGLRRRGFSDTEVSSV